MQQKGLHLLALPLRSAGANEIRCSHEPYLLLLALLLALCLLGLGHTYISKHSSETFHLPLHSGVDGFLLHPVWHSVKVGVAPRFHGGHF